MFIFIFPFFPLPAPPMNSRLQGVSINVAPSPNNPCLNAYNVILHVILMNVHTIKNNLKCMIYPEISGGTVV